MAEAKRSFERYDLFDRKPYAEFLEKLILNSDSYHRDDDVQAYTIAIDSPWGTGKSVFLEMFENMLETDCPDRIRVVHYSAWKNDFWDNAFEPFADAIFTSEWFCSALEDDTNEQAMKNFFGAAKNVMLSFVKKQTEDHFDAELLAKAIEDFAIGLKVASSKKASFVSKSYLDYAASLRQMQKAMSEVLSKTLPGGKLVIVIDELDRCRPTFAIETLEIVKHIMDVKDVVYIFALDVRQLGAAIKKVYGADTDATGYLMRFFSYCFRMPEADIGKLLEKQLCDVPIAKEYPSLVEQLEKIAKLMRLNARDVETIGKAYRIMVDNLLKEYKAPAAFRLYWTLLCAKYKMPIDFDRYMKGIHEKGENTTDIFWAVKNDKTLNLSGPLNKAISDKPISSLCYNKFNEGEQITFQRWSIKAVKIVDDSTVKIFTDYLSTSYFSISETQNVSGLFFLPDLKRWNEIKDLTPAQFLLQQMEMFNFIPEIPSATE